MTLRRAGVPKILAAALLAAACTDTLSPGPDRRGGGLGVPLLDVAADGPARSGALGGSGRTLAKGFGSGNPHRGSAIVATFFWTGSTNIIQTVTDELSNGGRVGNTYTLVEYVQAGGVSMATYVALNAQGFPEAYFDPARGDSVLVVRATLSDSVADGGVMVSAWTGVSTVGAARSASGSGSTTTPASTGGIAVNAGALVYGVTMANAVTQVDPPAGFNPLLSMSDAVMWTDGEYAVPANAGPVNPQWSWRFTRPSTWLATVLSLNTGTPPPPPPPPPPAAPAAGAVTFDQRGGSLNERGLAFRKGFDLGNPHLGSAIVATFFWHGSTDIIQSVTDHLSNGMAVGNTYNRVAFVTSGGISMATYVALNVQRFPEL